MTPQRIIPNIWCNRNAVEAGEFYAAALPSTTSEIGAHYPQELPDFQADFAGEVLTVDLRVDGFLITLINAGDEFRPNPAISFMLNFDPLLFGRDEAVTLSRLDEVWAKLGEGGRVLMELGEYPFSKRYGWVEDRYGVSWQLILTDPEGAPRPFVIPQLMFAGPVQNHAREAAEYYCSLFDDSGLGMVADYQEQTGPANAGSVIFGEFRLFDQWFAMMDSAVEQDFTFTPGVSLEVRCDDQAEIDRYWDALVEGGQEQPCGWLKDRFGVSWQVVPTALYDLLSEGDEGRIERANAAVMSTFGKLDLAAIQAAADAG